MQGTEAVTIEAQLRQERNDALGALLLQELATVDMAKQRDEWREIARRYESERDVARAERDCAEELVRELRDARDALKARFNVKTMVDRFLTWKLPETFNPDGGIGFDRAGRTHAEFTWPVGTNLFTAVEAEAMVRHMVDEPGRSNG